jgi:hypothetical protein
MAIDVYFDADGKAHALEQGVKEIRLVDFGWNLDKSFYDSTQTQISIRLAMEKGEKIVEHPYPNDYFKAPILLSLVEVKRIKRQEIDEKTRQIIYAGCPYAGKLFSMDMPDQSTWHGLYAAVNSGLMKPPITVVTIDDEPYVLNTVEEFNTMYQVGWEWVGKVLNDGRQIKYAVNACLTVEDVENVVDDRKVGEDKEFT